MSIDLAEVVAARRCYPTGSRVVGAVGPTPSLPARSGVFVDLGGPPMGFVDGLSLPSDPAEWPPIGTTSAFEVFGHRPGQVRLWPLEARWQRQVDRFGDVRKWARIRARYRLGQLVRGTVDKVYAGGEYGAIVDDWVAVVEWADVEPVVGQVGDYRIVAVLDTTRRILLEPLQR